MSDTCRWVKQVYDGVEVVATECQFFIEYPKAMNLAFCPGCQRSYSIDGTATPDGVEATT